MLSKEQQQQKAPASAGAAESLKRKRALMIQCASLSSGSAADLGKWIEREYPSAVKRSKHEGQDKGAKERLVVNLDALDETPSRPDAIVARVYADTPRHLWPLAARNVLAHLEKLALEKKVEQDLQARTWWIAKTPGDSTAK